MVLLGLMVIIGSVHSAQNLTSKEALRVKPAQEKLVQSTLREGNLWLSLVGKPMLVVEHPNAVISGHLGLVRGIWLENFRGEPIRFRVKQTWMVKPLQEITVMVQGVNPRLTVADCAPQKEAFLVLWMMSRTPWFPAYIVPISETPLTAALEAISLEPAKYNQESENDWVSSVRTKYLKFIFSWWLACSLEGTENGDPRRWEAAMRQMGIGGTTEFREVDVGGKIEMFVDFDGFNMHVDGDPEGVLSISKIKGKTHVRIEEWPKDF